MHAAGSQQLNTSKHPQPPQLAIIVPCYNEEEALPAAASALDELLGELRKRGLASETSYLCFVDDGSSDATWATICRLCGQNAHVQAIKLARNFGHQGAILAGMFEVSADAMVTIDADLQDDEKCIGLMLEKYREGCEVVVGVRSSRMSDSFFKRFSAKSYYRLLRLLGVKIVYNHADYRLLSRRAVDLLRGYTETNLFLRGVVPLLGLQSAIVEYARRPRVAGESKYPLRKMAALAWDGITSFSAFPLRIVAALGLLISAGAMAVSAWALYVKLVSGAVVPGWASTVIPMYFLGGLQILCLGVIGEYVGKIYLETKHRPKYLIDQFSGEYFQDRPDTDR
jgi:glycosyltransferase involved in cell wall biosynthesis